MLLVGCPLENECVNCLQHQISLGFVRFYSMPPSERTVLTKNYTQIYVDNELFRVMYEITFFFFFVAM